mmetsp:Transcript_9605/g.20262  ORF Transcript_9605/g.20262 Transcript_9605/m.20262 type:complete len:208 (+) Transcript_9605:56-679(+)
MEHLRDSLRDEVLKEKTAEQESKPTAAGVARAGGLNAEGNTGGEENKTGSRLVLDDNLEDLRNTFEDVVRTSGSLAEVMSPRGVSSPRPRHLGGDLGAQSPLVRMRTTDGTGSALQSPRFRREEPTPFSTLAEDAAQNRSKRVERIESEKLVAREQRLADRRERMNQRSVQSPRGHEKAKGQSMLKAAFLGNKSKNSPLQKAQPQHH